MSKPFTESTTAELEERLKKHKFCIKLIENELESRKKKDSTPKTKVKTDVGEKISATKDDMKKILTDNKIEYKSSFSKDELYKLIKKNNLVRMTEEYHSKRVKN